jgi:23S rRNA (cytosine1962-C5)-methyltransferase
LASGLIVERAELAAAPAVQVILKPGREGPVRGRNPWIFSQAIARVEPSGALPGTPVEVRDHQGAALGVGYYHPGTTIAVRMIGFGAPAALADLIVERLRDALRLRAQIVPDDTSCYRLVNGDGDGLSGLVVDRYDDVLVVQILTAGMERLRPFVIAQLQSLLHPRAIVERSMGAVRREEGLPDRSEVVMGTPPGQVVVRENGWPIEAGPGRGQKTGYFLDQRVNRRLLARLAGGKRMLDAYCYAGGFALAALMGGAAHVVGVDSSAGALEWARANLDRNRVAPERALLVCTDAHRYLAQAPPQFDVIVLDPPALARSRKDAARAERLYIELNRLALRALAPGGMLMTFSCSTHLRGEDFLRAVRSAQSLAGRSLRLLARLGAGPDHPVMLGHAEGEYLTGALLADLAP